DLALPIFIKTDEVIRNPSRMCRLAEAFYSFLAADRGRAAEAMRLKAHARDRFNTNPTVKANIVWHNTAIKLTNPDLSMFPEWQDVRAAAARRLMQTLWRKFHPTSSASRADETESDLESDSDSESESESDFDTGVSKVNISDVLTPGTEVPIGDELKTWVNIDASFDPNLLLPGLLLPGHCGRLIYGSSRWDTTIRGVPGLDLQEISAPSRLEKWHKSRNMFTSLTSKTSSQKGAIRIWSPLEAPLPSTCTFAHTKTTEFIKKNSAGWSVGMLDFCGVARRWTDKTVSPHPIVLYTLDAEGCDPHSEHSIPAKVVLKYKQSVAGRKYRVVSHHRRPDLPGNKAILGKRKRKQDHREKEPYDGPAKRVGNRASGGRVPWKALGFPAAGPSV
ncbi:hypothetical protein BD626DRAFT_542063, partial [Schizophyllum amplum]